MLEWVLIAVLAQMSFAFGALIDKIVRGKYFGDSTSMAVMLMIAQALPVVLLLFADIGGIGMAEILLALFAGVVTVVPLWLYSESLKNDDVSSVAPLWQAIPVLVLVLAYIFLGERLPPLFYFAFALMLAGSLLVSGKELKAIAKPSRIFWLMLAASFAYAVQIVVLKYAYNRADFLGIFALMCFGRVMVSAIVLALPGRLAKFANCVSSSDKRILVAMVAVNTAAVVLYNYAITLGPVTIVEAISGFYPFFVLLFAAAFARWMPLLLEERLWGRELALKVFAITLMLAGLVILYL